MNISCGMPASSSVSNYYALPEMTSSSRMMWEQSFPPKNFDHSISRGPIHKADTISRPADVDYELTSRIVEYSNLADDWDGYGGKAARLATVMDALDFLRRYPSTLPKPRPTVTGAGVIGLYWEGNGCYASIDFDGSGGYCYLADRPGDKGGEDRVPLSAPLPQRLLEVIALVAGPTHRVLPPLDPNANGAFAALLSRMPEVGYDDDFERTDETAAPLDVFD
jgi:hypothetical protein